MNSDGIMNISGKSVLVTGGDGFIGSHLVEALVRDGARVTAMAQYNPFGDVGWLDDLDEEIAAAEKANQTCQRADAAVESLQEATPRREYACTHE